MGPKSSDLFNDYYTAFDPDIEYREHDLVNDFNIGIYHYVEGQSAQALEIFNKLKHELSGDPSFEFYYSLVLIDNQQYDLAKEKLEELGDLGDFMLPEVYWYLALLEINKENFKKGREYLSLIKDEDSKAHSNEVRKLKRIIRFR